MNALTHLNGLLQTNGGNVVDLNSYTLLQSAGDFGPELMTIGIVAAIAAVVIGLGTAAYWASRYKKCPSNKILVVYGSGVRWQVCQDSARWWCFHHGRSFNLTSSCRLSPFS